MKKRVLSSLFMVLFAVCFIYANRDISQDSLTTWQEQLEYVKNNLGEVNEGDVGHLSTFLEVSFATSDSNGGSYNWSLSK